MIPLHELEEEARKLARVIKGGLPPGIGFAVLLFKAPALLDERRAMDRTMNWLEFKQQFPNVHLTDEELAELLGTGFVAVGVGDRRVFTLRIEAEESDIPEWPGP